MPDVVVVGAGPVGSLIAALLHKSGIDVTVYEQRGAISRLPRAVGIHPPAVSVLRQLGLQLRGARSIIRGEARDGSSILGAMLFDPPVLTLPQHQLQAELDAFVPQIRRGTPVVSIEQTPHDVRVSITGGSIGARLVIVADGVDSSIRADLGARWQRRPGRGRYLMADIDEAPATEDEAVGDATLGSTTLGDAAVLWFTQRGVVESFPLPESRRRWVARSATGTDLARIVFERTGVRLASAIAKETSVFVASQHVADHWVHGRTVLLGDTAHEISPIGGQGMNLGILDAAALAPRVISALQGDLEALSSWERERRGPARKAMAQAAFNMSVGVPIAAPLQPVRQLIVRTLARGPASRSLARAFTMQDL